MSHRVAFQRTDGAHSKDGIVRLWTRSERGEGWQTSPGGRDEPELGLAHYGAVSLRSESEGHCERKNVLGREPEKEDETKSQGDDLTKQRFSCLAGAFCRDHPVCGRARILLRAAIEQRHMLLRLLLSSSPPLFDVVDCRPVDVLRLGDGGGWEGEENNKPQDPENHIRATKLSFYAVITSRLQLLASVSIFSPVVCLDQQLKHLPCLHLLSNDPDTLLLVLSST